MFPHKRRVDLAATFVASEKDASTASCKTEPATVRCLRAASRQLGAPWELMVFRRSLPAPWRGQSESPRLNAVQLTGNGACAGSAK